MFYTGICRMHDEKNYQLVIGIGKTGWSCVEYLTRRGEKIRVIDTREEPANLHQFKQKFPNIPLHLGNLLPEWIFNAQQIIVSPGVSTQQFLFEEAKNKGIPILGDIDLFAQNATSPVCGITGSNGKSTVTTLVHEMAKAAQISVQCGGNLGTPVLEIITSPEPELYVLELSSFQLETMHSLPLQVATILNLSPNHLDRYGTMENYQKAKQRIYQDTQFIVCNRDDPATFPNDPDAYDNLVTFGLSNPKSGEFGIIELRDNFLLAFGDQELLSVDEMYLKGRHNAANALAALAIGHVIGFPLSAMISTLQTFRGLAHRCQFIGNWNDVHWFNDSKATNVTATLAAIVGLGSALKGKLVVLLGGQDKGDDFTKLLPAIHQFVRSVVVYGQDADKIKTVLHGHILVEHAKNFAEAITTAHQQALPGDAVLLSPACASYDMFRNFEHRGEMFIQLVEEIVAS